MICYFAKKLLFKCFYIIIESVILDFHRKLTELTKRAQSREARAVEAGTVSVGLRDVPEAELGQEVPAIDSGRSASASVDEAGAQRGPPAEAPASDRSLGSLASSALGSTRSSLRLAGYLQVCIML